MAFKLAGLRKYMSERERIRLAKEAGEPWPWTQDKILQTYKFTNVKRMHDRTTKVFLAHYETHFTGDLKVLLYNCAVARYFGTSGFIAELGWMKHHDARHLTSTAKRMEAAGQQVFTGAYMVRSDPGPKRNTIARYVGGVWGAAHQIVTALALSDRWEAAYRALTRLPGFGGAGFMAKEVLQDFLMLYSDTVRDRDTWTPVGPGARRGLNRLAGRPLNKPQREEVWIAEVQQVHAALRVWWAQTTQSSGALTAHDVQFCLCEFDKYERVRTGMGRPRSLYHPKES